MVAMLGEHVEGEKRWRISSTRPQAYKPAHRSNSKISVHHQQAAVCRARAEPGNLCYHKWDELMLALIPSIGLASTKQTPVSSTGRVVKLLRRWAERRPRPGRVGAPFFSFLSFCFLHALLWASGCVGCGCVSLTLLHDRNSFLDEGHSLRTSSETDSRNTNKRWSTTEQRRHGKDGTTQPQRGLGWSGTGRDPLRVPHRWRYGNKRTSQCWLRGVISCKFLGHISALVFRPS